MPTPGESASFAVSVTGVSTGGAGDTLAAEGDDTTAADALDTLAVDVGGIFIFVGKSAAEAI